MVGEAMSVLTVGAGFPDGVQIPVKVGTCGDGIHVAFVDPSQDTDCECGKMTVHKHRAPFRFARFVFPDAQMDDVEVGQIKTLHGRRARP